MVFHEFCRHSTDDLMTCLQLIVWSEKRYFMSLPTRNLFWERRVAHLASRDDQSDFD